MAEIDVIKALLSFLALLCFYQAPALSQEMRFRSDGEKLYFNSNVPYDDDPAVDIIDRDSDELGVILMENLEITTIILESNGGDGTAALKMAQNIEDFGLATEVQAGCYSACPYIFLAGRPRVLRKGGVLGFHRSSIGAEELRALYVKSKSPDVTKYSPSEFAYNDGINSVAEVLHYMLRHNVTPEFALEVMNTPPTSMLEPAHKMLREAGIIDAE